MHGNLLEIEGKLLESRLPIADPRRFKELPPASAPFMPENIAHLCLECLQVIDQEIGTASLSKASLGWTQALMLTNEEIEFGLRLHVDFLDDDRERWLHTLSDYQNAVLPALKQLYSIGFVGWLQGAFTKSVPRFMALGLVFEAMYRLSAQLTGFSIAQFSRPKATGQFKTQYKMLDARPTGICTDTVMDRLVRHVDGNDRDTAKRSLRLAIKARNAFAHGAVSTFDQKTADGMGHLLVKAIQTLVTCGLDHMVHESAYFNWREFRGGQHGFHAQDWDIGTRRVFQMIRKAAMV